ncbi:hypothetical protein AURDEDRAFT_129441 [Auricularia subglabra TFB-10046 SS5]|nr:hypothetical protein AURDEDRAFT_129441 [Auricularia subglabra TFB-10046 SS5]
MYIRPAPETGRNNAATPGASRSIRPDLRNPHRRDMVADCPVDLAKRLFVLAKDTRPRGERVPTLAIAACGTNVAQFVTRYPGFHSRCMQCSGNADEECGGPWPPRSTRYVPGVKPTFHNVPAILPGAAPVNGASRLLEDVNMLRDNSDALRAALSGEGIRIAGAAYPGVSTNGAEHEALPELRPVFESDIPCPRTPGKSLARCPQTCQRKTPRPPQVTSMHAFLGALRVLPTLLPVAECAFTFANATSKMRGGKIYMVFATAFARREAVHAHAVMASF